MAASGSTTAIPNCFYSRFEEDLFAARNQIGDPLDAVMIYETTIGEESCTEISRAERGRYLDSILIGKAINHIGARAPQKATHE